MQSDFSKLYQKWLYEIIPFPKIVKFLASSLCFILSLLFTKVKDNKKGPFLVGKCSITFRWNVSQLSQVQKNDATFSSYLQSARKRTVNPLGRRDFLPLTLANQEMSHQRGKRNSPRHLWAGRGSSPRLFLVDFG